MIDCLQENFTKNGKTYDVVFDAVGATRSVGYKKVVLGVAGYTKKDVLFLKELIEAGRYRAVIDRTYPLEDVVEAHRYADTMRRTGNVVPTVDGSAR